MVRIISSCRARLYDRRRYERALQSAFRKMDSFIHSFILDTRKHRADVDADGERFCWKGRLHRATLRSPAIPSKGGARATGCHFAGHLLCSSGWLRSHSSIAFWPLSQCESLSRPIGRRCERDFFRWPVVSGCIGGQCAEHSQCAQASAANRKAKQTSSE